MLTPISKSFGIWKETPIPMYLKIYLFNWTNPNAFSKTVKPIFEEIGPFVFKEVDYKVNRIWNKNSTITFEQKRVWHFDQSMSNGTLDTLITNVNPVAATLNYKVRNKGKLLRLAANGFLKALNEKKTVTKTVAELLFDGYNDRLLDFAKELHIPGLPYDKFGWFYSRNNSNTYDGIFNMYTGEEDMSKLGVLAEWNYSNHSKIYPGNCSAIDGSLGDLWPPLNDIHVTPVFAPDTCTLLHLYHNGSTEWEGLTGKKFVSTKEMFDNGTKVPSRSCYCENVECQPSGTLNVSTCKYGAPAFISLPHFYLADESYRNAVEGMKPNKKKHEFYIVVEPEAGIPMQVRAKLQLNLMIEPVKDVKMFENYTRTFMPMLWFRQEADLTSDFATQIKFLFILPVLGHVTFYGIAVYGCLLFVIGVIMIVRAHRKAEDNQRLIAKIENNVGQAE